MALIVGPLKRALGGLGGPVLLLLATLGCGHPEPASDEAPVAEPHFSQRDSAGILISTTQGSNALGVMNWIIDSVPDLVLGNGPASSNQFFRIGGARALSEGGILVVDGGSAELRVFGPSGTFSHRTGGMGDGPGEYRDPVLVRSPGTDSVLIWDTNHRQLDRVSTADLGHRKLDLPAWPAGGRPPVGAIGDRLLLELPGLPAFGQPGLSAVDVVYEWLSLSGESVTITSFSVPRHFTFVEPGRPPGMSLVPFTVAPSAMVSLDGALITEGVHWEIRWYALNGDLRKIFRVNEVGRLITSAVVEAQINVESAGESSRRATLRKMYSEMPIPDTLPAFDTLLPDAAGGFWAEIYDWNPLLPKRWMVFDEDGQALGTVLVPIGLDLRWIDRKFVLGIWVDELGVQQVRRHSLRR
jgi:hypothetical protein